MLSKIIAAAVAIPLVVGGAVGVAYAAEPPVVEPVETAVEPVETPAPPAVEPVEAVLPPVETTPALAGPTDATPARPEPAPFASTNDPQDPEGPKVTFSQPAIPDYRNGWHEGPVEVQIGATVGQGSIESIAWELSGASTGSGSKGVSPAKFTISNDGVTTVTATVTDTAEFVAVEEYTVRIDSSGPVMTIASPAPDAVYEVGETITYDFTCTDAASGVYACAAYPTSGDPVPSGGTVTFTTPGERTLYFGSSDKAGNITQVSVDVSIVPAAEPDTTAPVLSFGSTQPLPASGWSVDPATKLVITATDASAIDRVEYRTAIEGGGWSSWNYASSSASTILPFATSGVRYLEFRATDAAGNTSEPVETTWRADYEISGATISGFRATFDLDEAYELNYSCTDALSGVASCTSSVGPSGTALPTDVAGNFTFTLTNTDVAGNTKTTTWAYTVLPPAPEPDVTKPVLTISTIGEQPNAQGWLTGENVETHFIVTDNDPATRVWVAAAGADPFDGYFYTGPEFSYDVTHEGVTTLTGYAIDGAGNRSEPFTVVVKIDRTAPAISIVSPATGPASAVVADATFTKGEVVGLDYDCSDEHSGIASCTTTGAVSFLPTVALGEQSIEFVAVDAAGNRTVEELQYTVVAAPVGGNGNPNEPAQQPVTPAHVLANTGAPVWLGVLFVAGLLAAGATLLGVARSRR